MTVNWKLILGILFLVIILIFILTFKSNKEVVKIGAVLPLTGKGAPYGEEWGNAILMAVEDLNADGGVNGKLLEVVIDDSKTENAVAVTSMTKLVNVDNVKIVFSGLSGPVAAVAPVAEENKVILFGVTTATNWALENEYSFKDYTDIALECKFLGEKVKGKKIAFIGVNVDTTLDCINSLKNEGVDLVYELYTKEDNDFRSQITKVKDSGADFIMIRPLKAEFLILIKQMKELEFTRPLICPTLRLTGCDTKEFIEIGKEFLNGGIASGFYVYRDNPKVSQFFNRYKEKFGKELTGDGIFVYDDVKLLGKVLEICDKTGNIADTTCLKEEIKGHSFDSIAGKEKLKFDDKGVASREVALFKFENGSWVIN